MTSKGGNQAINNPFANYFDPNAEQSAPGGMNDMAQEIIKDQVMKKLNIQFAESAGYCSLEGFKIYFDVTNKYVLHKLKIILFPFMLKEDDWKRGQSNPYASEAF